jgi:myo-inositol-1(or 4)-monophosphatase
MTTTEFSEFTTAAIAIARQAGAILRESLGRVEQINFKGTVDLVTEVDKRSEEAIVGALTARFPNHRIVAEEGSGEAEGASPYRWLIDPLDGTTNYAHGHPYFGVSLALQHAGDLIVGVVYDPIKDELFQAERGGGAFLNGQPIQVSEIDRLIRGLIVTGFPYDAAKRPVALAHWHAFSFAAQGTRRNGAASLDLCSVACGRFDGYYEAYLGPWDCAAGALIVAEAGGRISDYHGQPFDPFRGAIVTSNGLLHNAMLNVLADATPPGTVI